jgi:hypothetical protein
MENNSKSSHKNPTRNANELPPNNHSNNTFHNPTLAHPTDLPSVCNKIIIK